MSELKFFLHSCGDTRDEDAVHHHVECRFDHSSFDLSGRSSQKRAYNDDPISFEQLEEMKLEAKADLKIKLDELRAKLAELESLCLD